MVVGATAYMQIRLNSWNRPFYNALTNKDMSGFLSQLWVFGEIAGILLVLNVAQMWLNQSSKVVLRQGLVNDLLNQWLKPKRAFRLSNSGAIGANPDQRLQADAQHLTDLSTDLGIGLLQSSSSFAHLCRRSLGALAGPVSADRGSRLCPARLSCLVRAALCRAASYRELAGRPSADRPQCRALCARGRLSFRARADKRAHRRHHPLRRRSRRERPPQRRVRRVLDISRRIVNAVTRLTWVTAGYGWFTIIAPILVAAPAYFRSNISFGELMVIVGAFNQVQTALRWFVDNFSNLADWRATLLRVARFRKAIMEMDDLGQATSRIQFSVAADRRSRSTTFTSLRPRAASC